MQNEPKDQYDIAKSVVQETADNMMANIRNQMIKEVVDNIEYYSRKLEECRLQLKVLQNGRID